MKKKIYFHESNSMRGALNEKGGHKLLLLSGKNKLKALYPFTHRCCSRFTYPGAWFSVLNCKHYKMCLF